MGIAYNDGVFTETLRFSGMFTDATHSITITVDPGNRHTGIAGSGVVVSGSGGNPTIGIEADYVTVESNLTTLLVSLEMSRLELAQRMLCSRGKIDGRKFRGGYLSGELLRLNEIAVYDL